MKQINKICSCGKIIINNIRKRYCDECATKKRKQCAKEIQLRRKFNLPNKCNVCSKEIPVNKQKCKQCLGYNKVCTLCNIVFKTSKRDQKFCKPRCYYDYISAGLTKEKKTNLDYQELIKKFEALQHSYKLLEAVDETNVLLLEKYRNENVLLKKELDWIKLTGDNNECSLCCCLHLKEDR